MTDCFDHIIDGESSHTSTCQGLHFDTCLVRYATFTTNQGGPTILRQLNVNVHFVKRKWVTEWNQITCLSLGEE